MKEFIDKIRAIFITLLPLIIIIAILAIAIGSAYLISASNLPDWMKFYLLSR